MLLLRHLLAQQPDPLAGLIRGEGYFSSGPGQS